MRWLLPLLIGLSACGDPAEETGAGPCDTAPELTWQDFGSSFFATWCDACHAASSPNRFGAPDSVTFDTEEEVRQWEARIVQRVLVEGTMPLGGGVYEEDLALLESWLECGL